MEAWLADYFHVSRAVTPDVQLIHLLESDLGWKNMSAVTKFSELKTGSYRGKSYIVSYEKTPGTDSKDAFWHTVHVEIGSNGKAAITDRQATGMGQTGSIADSALPRSRAAPITWAPRAASARAVSTPRPAETPVTSTRLPRRSTPASTSSVVECAPKIKPLESGMFRLHIES